MLKNIDAENLTDFVCNCAYIIIAAFALIMILAACISTRTQGRSDRPETLEPPVNITSQKTKTRHIEQEQKICLETMPALIREDGKVLFIINKNKANTSLPSANVIVSMEDAQLLAKVIWGEARGVKSKTEQAAVAWCVLNRVDSNGYGCGTSIEYVLTFPNQFAYDADAEYSAEIYQIALKVLTDWQSGKEGIGKQWKWFTGDGKRNTFRDQYIGGNTMIF